jgi:Hemerythrin HHE cation binding domain
MFHTEPAPQASLANHPVDDVLGTHHHQIEAACLEIMSAAFTGDSRDLAARWRVIEREFLAHMAAEERLLLPAYQRAEPKNAQDLRSDHAVLRERALEIGVAIQLHTIRCEQLQHFVEALRAHAHREEVGLYRWAQDHVDINRRHTLFTLVR